MTWPWPPSCPGTTSPISSAASAIRACSRSSASRGRYACRSAICSRKSNRGLDRSRLGADDKEAGDDRRSRGFRAVPQRHQGHPRRTPFADQETDGRAPQRGREESEPARAETESKSVKLRLSPASQLELARGRSEATGF